MTINFFPKHYPSTNHHDCLVLCIRALLDFSHKSHLYAQMRRSLKPTQHGYDFFEAITALAKLHSLAEAGLYDTDYLPPQSKHGPLSYFDLKGIQKQSKGLPPHAVESLRLALMFLHSHPKLLKIQKPMFSIVDEWVKNGKPVCLNVGAAELTDSDDDSIHSIIVYGVTAKTVSVWDPLIGSRIVDKTRVARAWNAVGNYYLVVKDEGGQNSSPSF